MNLDLPTPEVTEGPAWAEALNQAQRDIDEHDHSTGKGAKVTPAGILINAALDMDGNTVQDADGLTLESQGATDSTPGRVYRVGDNLYYNNAAGVAVQITSGTTVNVSGLGSGYWSVSLPGGYPYSVTSADDHRILMVNTSAARTLNLPAATTAMYFQAKDITGTAGTNNISVVPDGTDTIDGVNATYVVNSNYAALGFISDGASSWFVV
jgi:hypothetical protein